MNDEPTAAPDPVAKKPPRKPRPSEIAAKAAKVAKKKKPAAKKTKPKAKPKAKGGNKPLVRTERLDLRLTKQEKAKIMARSRKTKRTVTSVIMEAIHKVKW